MNKGRVMAILDAYEEYDPDPAMDVVETVIRAQGWNHKRVHDDEMAAEYRGKWCDYSLHFAWSDEISAFHFTCAFDVRIPAHKTAAVHNLLAMVNDRLWLGHFCVWHEEGLPMYRHALPLRRTHMTAEQVEDLLDVAISECERFYPAFQYVVWGGKSPKEALEAAIVDPVGEA
jgi:hypothetical protein